MTRGILLRFVSVALIGWGICIGMLEAARAHELRPSLGDLSVKNGILTLQLSLNAEALVAGIDLDATEDSEGDPHSDDYDLLRGLSPDELAPMVHQFSDEWFSTLVQASSGPIDLQLEALVIPETGDITQPRRSRLRLTGQLPKEAETISVLWPRSFGALVLRQYGVNAPFSGYLNGGDRAVSIPIAGGASISVKDVFWTAMSQGFHLVISEGYDQILFMLALFFLSARLHVIFWQFAVFSFGLISALIIAGFGYVAVAGSMLPVLVACTVVWAGVENIVSRRLRPWRIGMMLIFGGLHGLALAEPLAARGLSQAHILLALVGYGLGIELALLMVVAILYVLLGYSFGSHAKYRGRVAMPASLMIVLLALYWVA